MLPFLISSYSGFVKGEHLFSGRTNLLSCLERTYLIIPHQVSFFPSFLFSTQKLKMAATFSYAQAAKGMSSTPLSVKPTSAEPNKGASSPEEQNNDSTAQANQNNAETDASREAEKTVASNAKEAEPVAAATAKQNASGTSSPSIANSSTTAPKDEDSSNTVNGTSDSTWDKQSQASGQEKTNGASTEEAKEKSAEKEKNVPPPKELKAAPLPPVNIWQQRKEAQDARSKTAEPIKSAAPAAKSGAAKTASTASSTSGDNQQDLSRAASRKKGTDAMAEGAKPRSKADGGKGRDDGKPERSARVSWSQIFICRTRSLHRLRKTLCSILPRNTS